MIPFPSIYASKITCAMDAPMECSLASNMVTLELVSLRLRVTMLDASERG